jgi:hypothetical protein
VTDRPVVVLHRIVRSSPPTLADFTSKAALGLVNPRADSETQRLESGVSMYRTLTQARKKARAFPFLGGYVATVALPFSSEIAVERMLQSSGHHTVWGEPEFLLACVVATDPVVP